MKNMFESNISVKDKINSDLQKAFDNEKTVLLSGVHGSSKTARVLQIARDNNVVLKYFSCPTLDPYTDLVGVPTPRKYCKDDKLWFATEKTACPTCNKELYGEDSPVVESLKLVRPTEIDAAEMIFFDEFNRADPKIINAAMEILQSGTLNGEKLTNLKVVWAAINPPNHEADYEVDEIDLAVMDRFDIYVDIVPKPNIEYLASVFRDEPTIEDSKLFAKALVEWWTAHSKGKIDFKTNYISPRRLQKMGEVFIAMGNVKPAIPSWMTIDSNKLQLMLVAAKKGETNSEDILSGIGGSKNTKYKYPIGRNSTSSAIETHIKYYSSTPMENPQEIRNRSEEIIKVVSWAEFDVTTCDSDRNYLRNIIFIISRSNSSLIAKDFINIFKALDNNNGIITANILCDSIRSTSPSRWEAAREHIINSEYIKINAPIFYGRIKTL